MKEKLDPIKILNGIIFDLTNRAENQEEIGDSIALTKLVEKIEQVKKQYLFEISQQEYSNTVPN